jgi:hypothetical protein
MFYVMINHAVPVLGVALALAAVVYGLGRYKVYSPKIVEPINQRATDVIRPLENVITNVRWPINY